MDAVAVMNTSCNENVRRGATYDPCRSAAHSAASASSSSGSGTPAHLATAMRCDAPIGAPACMVLAAWMLAPESQKLHRSHPLVSNQGYVAEVPCRCTE